MGDKLRAEIAVVTGAGRGIGRAIAISLASEGAAVGVFARTPQEIAATADAISGAGGGRWRSRSTSRMKRRCAPRSPRPKAASVR